MLYLDNAATANPRPQQVKRAVAMAMERLGANPGRSGHKLSLAAAEQVYCCRELAAKHFGVGEPENVVFTSNCTQALNMVILSLLAEGGHCVISDMEHNSVLRPLYALSKSGAVSYEAACVEESKPKETLENFRSLIREDTKLVICTGASNAFGIKPPVRDIAALCSERGVPFLLDAAQTAGTERYDMKKDNIDFIAAPGHKGLMGPMGTGLLATQRPELLAPLMFGGTGSVSLEREQPENMPDKLESGTLNVPGIAGLAAGIDWVEKKTPERIGKHELALAGRLYDGLALIPGVKLFTARPAPETHSAVVSFLLGSKSGEETATLLDEHGIASRGGYHCAALAHEKMGTVGTGVCRLSFGPFNSGADVEAALRVIKNIQT